MILRSISATLVEMRAIRPINQEGAGMVREKLITA